MSKWVGKYVIGLTGNIGTGKSVVRRMLEHLGAYGIDADALSHRVIAKDAPGYQPIVKNFGRWVLGPDGQIDRAKLARVVFSDPEALKTLEGVIHPLVNQAIDFLIQRSKQRVVVIEAIKLLEAGIGKQCDSIWVTYAPPEAQSARLMKNRHMSREDAQRRIMAQPPQAEKLSAATVIIKNTGTFTDTWKQVVAAWEKILPGAEDAAKAAEAAAQAERPAGEIHVLRARPRHSAQIADLINHITKPKKLLSQDDIMEAFGEKAFLLLQVGHRTMGAIGWQVENLVSRSVDVIIDPSLSPGEALPPLFEEVERASRDLQCEASLVFVRPELAKQDALWRKMGYEQTPPQRLSVQAWKEAAQELMPEGTILYFKQLRQDRVLRPI